MITVGLVKELQFISEMLKTPVKISINCEKINHTLTIKLEKNILEAWYLNNKIWEEDVKDDLSMFGIESCDAIAKIIFAIDIGSQSWQELVYFENKN